MKHECFWDAAHACARLRIVGELTPAQAEVLMDQLEALYVGKSKKLMLVDHTQSPQAVGRETREVLERRGEAINYDRTGFYGMTNLNRVVARIIVSLLGRSDRTGFFADEAEAVAWLTSE